MMRNYWRGIEDIYKCLAPLLNEKETQWAFDILQRDFSDPGKIVPTGIAAFLEAGPSEELHADVVDFVQVLLSRCGIKSA